MKKKSKNNAEKENWEICTQKADKMHETCNFDMCVYFLLNFEEKMEKQESYSNDLCNRKQGKNLLILIEYVCIGIFIANVNFYPPCELRISCRVNNWGFYPIRFGAWKIITKLPLFAN